MKWAERIPYPFAFRIFVCLWFGLGFCLKNPYSVLAHLSLSLQCVIHSVHNIQGNDNTMMWDWSAFLFFLMLYLPEEFHRVTGILPWKIQRQLVT